MGKAIAIAIHRNPILEFMYGTPERARLTFLFALGVAVLGCLMNLADGNAAFSVCSQDTLTAF